MVVCILSIQSRFSADSFSSPDSVTAFEPHYGNAPLFIPLRTASKNTA
jgi:hypothetical protein